MERKEKRRILKELNFAVTENAIRVYSDKNPSICYVARDDTGDKSVISREQRVEEQKEEPKKEEKKVKKILNVLINVLDVLLNIYAMLIISTLIMCFLYYAFGIEKVDLVFFFCSSFLVLQVIKCSIDLLAKHKNHKFSQRSKNAAVMKMIRFESKQGRLPDNFKEIEKTSRFSTHYVIEETKDQAFWYALKISLSTLWTIELILLDFTKSLTMYIIVAILFIIINIFTSDFVFRNFKKIFQILFQLSITVKKPTQADMQLALDVTKECLKHEYPEYSQNSQEN